MLSRSATSRRFRVAAVAGLIVVTGSGRASAVAPLTQIALTGQPAPIGSGGTSYLEIGNPSLNGAGQVAFQAVVGDGGAVDPDLSNSGIYLSPANGSGASPVVRTGDPSPSFLGSPGREFIATPAYILNGAGQIAFRAITADVGDATGDTQKTGLYIAHPAGAGIQEVVHTGPDGYEVSIDPEERVGAIDEAFAFGAAGDVAYTVELLGPPGSAPGGGQSNHTVAVRHRPDGAHVQVAREGEPAPGNGAGVVFNTLGGPRVDAFSGVRFTAGLAGTGVIAGSNNHAFYFSDATRGGQLSRTLRNGQPVNTTGPVLTGFNVTAVNAVGQHAVAGFLAGPGYGPESDQVLLRAGNQDFVDIIAREGDYAPGADWASYAGMSGMALNAMGGVAYIGYLKGTGVITGQNDVALFGGLLNAPQLLLRSGSPAPGMAAGDTIQNLGTFALNEAGQMAFLATVDTDPSAELSLVPALYTYDPSGVVSLVAALGEQVEVAPGEFRVISDIGFDHMGSASEGLASSFNDAGTLAFVLSFSDGSRGVYTASVAVPEPATTGAIAALAGVVLLRRRQRPVSA